MAEDGSIPSPIVAEADVPPSHREKKQLRDKEKWRQKVLEILTNGPATEKQLEAHGITEGTCRRSVADLVRERLVISSDDHTRVFSLKGYANGPPYLGAEIQLPASQPLVEFYSTLDWEFKSLVPASEGPYVIMKYARRLTKSLEKHQKFLSDSLDLLSQEFNRMLISAQFAHLEGRRIAGIELLRRVPGPDYFLQHLKASSSFYSKWEAFESTWKEFSELYGNIHGRVYNAVLKQFGWKTLLQVIPDRFAHLKNAIFVDNLSRGLYDWLAHRAENDNLTAPYLELQQKKASGVFNEKSGKIEKNVNHLIHLSLERPDETQTEEIEEAIVTSKLFEHAFGIPQPPLLRDSTPFDFLFTRSVLVGKGKKIFTQLQVLITSQAKDPEFRTCVKKAEPKRIRTLELGKQTQIALESLTN